MKILNIQKKYLKIWGYNHVAVVVVVHTFNPSTQKTEASLSLSVLGQPGPYREFYGSQSYIV